MTEFEKFANLALSHMNNDEEFDAKLNMGSADDSLRFNPSQLSYISNLQIVGNLYASMIFYGWQKNRIANMAYWGLSKAIQNNPNDLHLKQIRILVMISVRKQLKETIAMAFNTNRSSYNPFDIMDSMFDDDEILDKIELAEIISNNNLIQDDTIRKRWGTLRDKYMNELSNPQMWLEKARDNEEKIFDYLNGKIFIKKDLDFE